MNCIQCNGTSTESTGICEKDEAGVSTTCLSTATTCAYSNCATPDGETMIIRACGDDEPPSKTETAPNFYVCQDYPILDYNCTVCACDTDNCNGATMNQISTVGIIAVTLLSFLNQ